MALQKLTYTKDWRNPQDFTTYEGNEAKVREDLQLLFTEAQTALNNLIDALGAGEIPFSATAAIDAANVQAAIEVVQAQIASAVTGSLPDDSIETAKYKDHSVTLAKLNSDVTPAGIGAAAAVHTHDDRYYTEEELTNLGGTGLLDQKQVKTSALPALADPVADNDSLPLYDQSDAASKKLSYVALKAALKTYFDTIYGAAISALDAHASRHAADGADPITVSTGNIADSAITQPKIADDAVSSRYAATIPAKKTVNDEEVSAWAYDGKPYTQDTTVSGITAAGGDLTVTAQSGASAAVTEALTHITFTPGADKISASSTERYDFELPIIVVQGSTPYNVTVGTTWTATGAPYMQEVTVEGVLATDTPLIDLVASEVMDTASGQLDSWREIFKIVAEAGKLKVFSASETSVDIPIQIRCVRK